MKWFTKKIYPRISDAFLAVYNELQSLQPRDTSTVRWVKGENGMEAHVDVGQSPSRPTEALNSEEPQAIYIRLKNYDAYIPKFYPVMITGYSEEDGVLSGASSRVPVLLSDWSVISDHGISEEYNPILGEFPSFGVIQRDAENDEVVSAVVGGLTPAYVDLTPGSSLSYCRATGPIMQSPLALSHWGNARILYRPQVTSFERGLCIVNLGMGPQNAYLGQFTVGYVGEDLYLHHPAVPGAVAGVVSIGTQQLSVPTTELLKVDGYVGVWVVYESGTFTVSVYQGEPGDSEHNTNPKAAYYYIASIVGGRVNQMHKSGSIVITDRWL